ncbi:MAG: hypothetical protein ABIW76_24560 [Fibrobacteria bacterium]
MKTEQLVINPKGDTLFMGNHFHVLEDKTAVTFTTNQIPEFVKFLKDTKGVKILCNPSALTAWPDTVDKYTKVPASCDLSVPAALAELKKMNGVPMKLAVLTEFMERFKRFTNAAGLHFIANLRHFKVRKIVKAEYNKEKNGDYSAIVSLESAGNEDFTPPDNITFEVPVFKHLSDQADTINLSFDLSFEIEDSASPSFNFTLTNFAFDDELLARQVDIINRHLLELPQVKLWGSQGIHAQDDGWKYKSNPLKD